MSRRPGRPWPTALVLTGTVVTYDEAEPVVRGGAVYVGPDGAIDAVQPRRRARRPASGGSVAWRPAGS